MTSTERAEILINKYSLFYLKRLVNGMIKEYTKTNNKEKLNHWNEIAVILKKHYKL